MNLYAQLQSPLLSIVTWCWSKRLRFGHSHGGILLPIQSLLCDMKVSFSLFITVSVPPGIFSLVSLPLRGSKRPCNLNSLAAPAWVPTTDSHPLWLCILWVWWNSHLPWRGPMSSLEYPSLSLPPVKAPYIQISLTTDWCMPARWGNESQACSYFFKTTVCLLQGYSRKSFLRNVLEHSLSSHKQGTFLSRWCPFFSPGFAFMTKVQFSEEPSQGCRKYQQPPFSELSEAGKH